MGKFFDNIKKKLGQARDYLKEKKLISRGFKSIGGITNSNTLRSIGTAADAFGYRRGGTVLKRARRGGSTRKHRKKR